MGNDVQQRSPAALEPETLGGLWLAPNPFGPYRMLSHVIHTSTNGFTLFHRWQMYQDNAKARRVQASGQDLEMALQMFYEERNTFFRPQRSTE